MRKLIFATLAACSLLSCNSSKVCKVTASLADVEDGMVYFMDATTREKIDSVEVENGKFTISLPASKSPIAVVRDRSSIFRFFAEPGEVVVTGNANTDHVVVNGTPSNDAYSEITKNLYDIIHKYHQCTSKEEADAIAEQYNEYARSAYEANKTNLAGPSILLNELYYDYSAKEIINEINSLPKDIADAPFIQEALAKANKKLRVEPQTEDSDIVPYYINVIANDPEGETISLESVVNNGTNRYVLLDFWASWCGPCMREVPYLKACYEKYHSMGFEIYGVSFDKDSEKWINAIKSKEMNWVHVSPLSSFNCQAAEDYCVEAIPSNFLIDCQTGIIIRKDLRGDDLAAIFDELYD